MYLLSKSGALAAFLEWMFIVVLHFGEVCFFSFIAVILLLWTQALLPVYIFPGDVPSVSIHPLQSFFFILFFVCLQGMVEARSFVDWKCKQFPADSNARDFLHKYNVHHYWDLALSSSIIESADD